MDNQSFRKAALISSSGCCLFLKKKKDKQKYDSYIIIARSGSYRCILTNTHVRASNPCSSSWILFLPVPLSSHCSLSPQLCSCSLMLGQFLLLQQLSDMDNLKEERFAWAHLTFSVHPDKKDVAKQCSSPCGIQANEEHLCA